MKSIQQKRVRLKKSNLHFILLLASLVNFSHIPAYSINLRGAKAEIEAITLPAIPKQGDTLIVKVAAVKDEEKEPKIFFNKTKYPAFIVGQYYRAFIPLEANLKPKKYGIDIHYVGTVKYIDIEIKPTNYRIENITLSKSASSLSPSKKELDLIGKALSTASSEKMWTGKFIFPSSAKQSTPYGIKRRFNGELNPDYFHKGLDFAGNTGSPIKAPERGKVILVGYNKEGFNINGNCVFLDHGHGIISAYLHLHQVSVKEGQVVNKGQLIGTTGSTGIATGPHLHWGIYANGKAVEPLYWINQSVE